ncbi:hypothetical protein [Hymenobacter cellulosilyticus]|uniref:DUF4468 domain-containing protein n=1 Tax=Hymenobacter cellulosilyticus TaxID=2932248 RepID=A0A8T9QDC9_9BACT|nr:hypothetical protein [Hymenobacter cellulosilyticus]UOQ72833.1 hypothetical protein MUN79_02235 [Hymenobacter cellulosilyticus]
MKTTSFTLTLLAALAAATPSQAQAPAATEQQALMKDLDRLMRNPQKPKQELHLALKGCHAEQIIRDREADVEMPKPLAVSYGGSNSGWSMSMDKGYFELKMAFEWADVTSITYALEKDEDEPKHYEIKIVKHKKGSNISFELPLYTTNEATVKDVVRRLEKVRQNCLRN